MTRKHTEKVSRSHEHQSFWHPQAAATQSRTTGFRPRTTPRLFAKTVGSFVPGLTRKAFEKYGFSAATLLTDWPLIAGADLASYARPERLKWPRLPGATPDAEDSKGRPGAILILRVDPARALDVEYRSRQIVERVNAYFGYGAIASLRLIQAPIENPVPAQKSSEPKKTDPADPGSDPLAAALARLEASVMGQASATRG
jgi:hypothetical protein